MFNKLRYTTCITEGLEGKPLSFMVAMCRGMDINIQGEDIYINHLSLSHGGWDACHPVVAWDTMENYFPTNPRFNVDQENPLLYTFAGNDWQGHLCQGKGETKAIAMNRALVLQKVGEKCDIPDVLLKESEA